MAKNSLAKRLKEVRGAESGRSFARRLDKEQDYSISDTMIGRYEKGIAPPPSDFIVAVCKMTDTSPTWLLTGQGEREWATEDERGALLRQAATLEDVAKLLREMAK